MNSLAPWVVAPVVLPMVASALLLLMGDARRRSGAIVNVAATALGLGIAGWLLWRVDAQAGPGAIAVHIAANWPAPFGIALVADRLSALMLVLVGLVGLGSALYATAGWSRAGAYFHPLFQIQLMGLNGAFLTADLFNLFVFFEVALAASYGLQLHASGVRRVRAGLHYLAVNLLASSLFLVGLAVLYGVMGTLSMADVADRMAAVAAGDRGLLHAGLAILAMAFLIKAAVWPLNAWLVPAYTAAATPVAALFVLMTKLGVYALLRVWTLLFPPDAATPFGWQILMGGGLATLAFGAIGMLASIRLDRIAAYSIMVSSGTLLAAFAFGTPAASAAALYYLAGATVAASGLFLLVELVQRTSAAGHARPAAFDEVPDEDDNLDDEQLPLVGRVFPVSVAALGLAFLACALMVAGLPPLAGFLAKVALLRAILQPAGAGDVAGVAWIMVGLLLAASLCATISLMRAGIRHFWTKGGGSAPRLRGAEAVAIGLPLVACVLLTVFAEPVLRYAVTTAAWLHAPRPYIDAVLSAPAVPARALPQEDAR